MTDAHTDPSQPRIAPKLRAAVHAGVGALSEAAWARLFPGEIEGWAYYKACETAPPEGFKFAAIAVYRGEEIVAAAPVFEMAFRLDTPLQSSWKAASDWLMRHAPGLIALKVVGLGSPLADKLHLGVAEALAPADRAAVVRCLLDGLDAHAAAQGAKVLAIKDLADTDLGLADTELKAAGFTRVASLPVAVLRLPHKSEAEYMARLSSATRKDIRRKLKAAQHVRIEYRDNIGGIEARVFELYEATRGHSSLDYGDFEKMSPAWFTEIASNLGERAVWQLVWAEDRLVGFNLLLAGKERVIDKFIGLEYPLATELNLYAVTWMENVRWCLAHGIREMQTGQTAYTMKVRLGSDLDKSWVYFRHRGGFWNLLFKTFGPMMDFAAHDPELKALRRSGRAKS